MDFFELNVLGVFRIQRAGQDVAGGVSDKARALLTFLALEGEQPRTILTALLWPNLAQEMAFDNLRKTIYRLRRRLEVDLIVASRQSVQLHPQGVIVDVVRFQNLLAECELHAHEAVVTCEACVARLADAVELYQGDLLAGFGLSDASDFEEWLLLRRETLQHKALLALSELTAAWEARGDMVRAHAYCTRVLALDPLREDSQRQMMRLLVQLGQSNQALQQFEKCRRLLREELGVEPDPATVELYEQIRLGKVQQTKRGVQEQAFRGVPPTTKQATPAPKWSDVPETGPIFGRALEIGELKRWLGTERCQVVAILGMGGVGKSTLAAATASALTPDFDQVIWRSLLNAPPLDELLRSVLQILARRSIAQQPLAQQPLAEFPTTLDGQLTLLLNEMHQQHCLLVLDNLESILQPEGIGQVRAGYEGYSQLIRRLAESRHNSTLLLTSRERLQGMARWEEDLPWVRSLQLEGLDASAAQAILNARGLGNHSAERYALVERYSGHPLALKLVAETIQELFEGDIAAFLASDLVIFDDIFDDIRLILDEQFARLSKLEVEVLVWLAIEREAVSVQSLRDNPLHSATPQALLEAVRSLQKRFLLENSVTGITLQNVIIEYTTAYLVEQVCQEIEDGAKGVRQKARGKGQSNSPSALSSSYLYRFALLKAQSKEYVRQSQARLILQPLAERLQRRLGTPLLHSTLAALLERLRIEVGRSPGYAGGNLFNLVRQLGFDVADYNFSGISVWQADFREVIFAAINLAHADLSFSAFKMPIEIETITFSASEQLWVTGFVDGAIYLWRAAGGQLHHAFHSVETNAALPVIISQDRQLLVSGGQDHALRIWSAEDGRCLAIFAGHTAAPYALAMSEDGQWVASSSYDRSLRLWDLNLGRLHNILFEEGDYICALAFDPDGMILASGGGERVICLWEVESGRLIKRLSGHMREIECLVFTHDGKWLVSGAHDGTIYLWDVASGQCLRTLLAHNHIVRKLKLHSDDRLLASGGADSLVRLWDLQSGELLHTFSGHIPEVNSLAFSQDGTVLASGGLDNRVQLWDTRSGLLLDSLRGHVGMVHTLCFNATGDLLASSGADGLVLLWDMRKYQPANASAIESSHSTAKRAQVVKILQGHQGDIRTLAFHPNGRLLATAGGDHTVQLWDVESGKALRTLRGHTDIVKALAFSPDGRWLASGGTDRTVCLWPMDNLSATADLDGLVLRGHEDDIIALDFSPDGQTLVSASLDRKARLWESATGRQLHILDGHVFPLSGVAFSPDGYVVTSSYDYAVRVWEPQSGHSVDRWPGHVAKAWEVTFSSASDLFACTTADQVIDIRRLSSGELLYRLSGHTKVIEAITFSPTAPILASSGWDGSIRLWNAETGLALDTLHAPGPYAGMNITGVTGITEAQKAALRTLGAYEQEVGKPVMSQTSALVDSPQSALSHGQGQRKVP